MSEAKKRYDKKTAKMVSLKFNVRTDADILTRLDRVGNKQGYIKRLIRTEMGADADSASANKSH